MASEVVCGSDSIDVALLGVAAKILDFEGMDTAFAGTNLIGMGDAERQDQGRSAQPAAGAAPGARADVPAWRGEAG